MIETLDELIPKKIVCDPTGMKSLERRTELAPSTAISTSQSCPSERQAFAGGRVILGATECLHPFVFSVESQSRVVHLMISSSRESIGWSEVETSTCKGVWISSKVSPPTWQVVEFSAISLMMEHE